MIKLLAVVALAACGGRKSEPTPPQPRVETGAGSATVADAPTEQDCEALLAHGIDVESRERGPESRLTADEQAKLRADMRPSFMPECRALSRTGYACALAATTRQAIDACVAK